MSDNTQPKDLSPDEIQVIKQTIMPPNATDAHLQLFLAFCRRKGFDPFLREVHPLFRTNPKTGQATMTLHVGIDAQLRRAWENPKFQGYLKPVYTVESKKEVGPVQTLPPELYNPREHFLVSVTVGCVVDGFREPQYATALFDEYVQTTGDGKPNRQWTVSPAIQLEKCAMAKLCRMVSPGQSSDSGAEFHDPNELPPGYHEDVEPEKKAPEPPRRTRGQVKQGAQEQTPESTPEGPNITPVPGAVFPKQPQETLPADEDLPCDRWTKCLHWLREQAVSVEGQAYAFAEMQKWCAVSGVDHPDNIPSRLDRAAYEYFSKTIVPGMRQESFLPLKKEEGE